jgi:hypothetical protein
MRPQSKRLALLLDALEAVVEALSHVPESDERQRLRGEAKACERRVRFWQLEAPSDEEREVVTKRVLGLHMATARLRNG